MADYQAQIVEFKKENVDVIALSVDPLDKAKEMVEKSGAAFPIGYGLKVPEDADKVGGRIAAEDALRSIQGAKKRKTQGA